MENDGIHRVGSVDPVLHSLVALEGELLGLHGLRAQALWFRV